MSYDEEETKSNNMIDLVAGVAELQEIADYLQDDDVTESLALVIRIGHESPKPQTVVKLITKLESKAFQFRMKGKYHMVLEKGGDAAKRKNLYMSLSEGLQRIVDSLKYIARSM